MVHICIFTNCILLFQTLYEGIIFWDYLYAIILGLIPQQHCIFSITHSGNSKLDAIGLFFGLFGILWSYLAYFDYRSGIFGPSGPDNPVTMLITNPMDLARKARFAEGCAKIICFCYKFIYLVPGGILERKGRSENRDELWKAYNWRKIL